METRICYHLVFIFGKFCEILRHKTQKYAFCSIKHFYFTRYATVDFSIVLLKIILVSCVHRYYIHNHSQRSLFYEDENFLYCDLSLLTHAWCWRADCEVLIHNGEAGVN